MDVNQFIAKTEELSGQSLDDEQKWHIKMWQRGRALGSVPPHAREEIQAMLDEYVLSEGDKLLSLSPSQKDEVLAQHAIAHAAAIVRTRFVNDYAVALEAGSKTPEVIKKQLRGSQVPPEAL